MTPPARVQAAIEVLAAVLGGAPAERTLTAWGRASRYAGSGDRAAVRDHVYDALRRLRSAAWQGGAGDAALEALDARAVMAGLLRSDGVPPADAFTGGPHAPAPIALPDVPAEMPEAVALDVPDWLRDRVGGGLDGTFAALRRRAPVWLRVNPARATRDAVLATLAEAGIAAVADEAASLAIRLHGHARGLTALPAWRDGWFELQDVHSQAVVDALPLEPGMRVLDLCAGGGGKALAMAARGVARLHVHDADPARMRDLAPRALRAGASVEVVDTPEAEAAFDVVLADVPCSGSGSWRRAPEAKWRLTPARLDALGAMQAAILRRATALARPGGWVAYATCSVLPEENARRVDAIAAGLGLALRHRLDLPCRADGGDGFHLSLMAVRGARGA